MLRQTSLRKLAIILVAGLVAGGGLWLALRPHYPSKEEIADRLRDQAEVQDSLKCGHDYNPGTSAYVECMFQSDAARTPPPELRGTLDIKPRDAVTGTARVGAAMVMLVTYVVMMLVFLGFWSLGTFIGLDGTAGVGARRVLEPSQADSGRSNTTGLRTLVTFAVIMLIVLGVLLTRYLDRLG
jgi:hypothetical protein